MKTIKLYAVTTVAIAMLAGGVTTEIFGMPRFTKIPKMPMFFTRSSLTPTFTQTMYFGAKGSHFYPFHRSVSNDKQPNFTANNQRPINSKLEEKDDELRKARKKILNDARQAGMREVLAYGAATTTFATGYLGLAWMMFR